MRELLLSVLPLLLLTTALSARAEDEVKPAVAADTTAAAPRAKADDKPFTPPPGWRQKKRGKFIVYCRKQSQMGTRLATEVCHDEEGIRAMLLAQREDQERVDQMRRVCSSQAACGAN